MFRCLGARSLSASIRKKTIRIISKSAADVTGRFPPLPPMIHIGPSQSCWRTTTPAGSCELHGNLEANLATTPMASEFVVALGCAEEKTEHI